MSESLDEAQNYFKGKYWNKNEQTQNRLHNEWTQKHSQKYVAQTPDWNNHRDCGQNSEYNIKLRAYHQNVTDEEKNPIQMVWYYNSLGSRFSIQRKGTHQQQQTAQQSMIMTCSMHFVRKKYE